MVDVLTRRRAIAVFASVAGLPLLRSLAYAERAASDPVIWHGQALGAPATLVLNHPDRTFAERLVREVVAEVARLEDIFSLYRAGSSLNELNRAGALAAPPPELVDLLARCDQCWQATDGAFDPTIQPLWALHARHFAQVDAAPEGPSGDALRKALKTVGFADVRANASRIAFLRPGMALTLNGVAQGFVTDHIVALLRRAGITSSLVDMGEPYALGARANGSAWRIGLAVSQDDEAGPILEVTNRAVATSSSSGFRFDSQGHFGHILDPRTGSSGARYRRVTVVAPDATTADAFSTAFNLMAPEAIYKVAQAHGALTVDLVPMEGVPSRFGAAI